MLPMLYTEHDLVALSDSGAPEGSPQLVDCWLRASSMHELQRRIDDALFAIDFDWMSYRSVTWRDGVPVTTRLFSSHTNPRWTQLYFDKGYHEIDPRLEQALASTLPFAWSVDEPACWTQHRQLAPEQLRFPELLRACGIGSGVLFVLPAGLRSNERTVIGLSSRKTQHAWIDDRVLAHSFMLALCLHELLSVHMSVANGTERSTVSPTRQEILWHLAQGQSNKQIAYRLQLSADTVKYHMRKLRHHFNVRNRMQLVNSLMCRGDPNLGSR
jgi:DNA-binding CsgD family transcriptional regulator